MNLGCCMHKQAQVLAGMCKYVWMHVHVHMCMWCAYIVYIYIYIYIYIHTYIWTHMHHSMWIHMHNCAYKFTHTQACQEAHSHEGCAVPGANNGTWRGRRQRHWGASSSQSCMHACVYVCMYVCVCGYIYIYIYIHTHTCTFINIVRHACAHTHVCKPGPWRHTWTQHNTIQHRCHSRPATTPRFTTPPHIPLHQKTWKNCIKRKPRCGKCMHLCTCVCKHRQQLASDAQLQRQCVSNFREMIICASIHACIIYIHANR